jgi:hypothetical protein
MATDVVLLLFGQVQQVIYIMGESPAFQNKRKDFRTWKWIFWDWGENSTRRQLLDCLRQRGIPIHDSSAGVEGNIPESITVAVPMCFSMTQFKKPRRVKLYGEVHFARPYYALYRPGSYWVTADNGKTWSVVHVNSDVRLQHTHPNANNLGMLFVGPLEPPKMQGRQ